MSDRAKQLMDAIYQERNTWADTENKLVAAILRKMLEYTSIMSAQNNSGSIMVIDKSDILTLSKEVEDLND